MNIENESILDATPGHPNGYVSKNMEWAAIPWGKKFIKNSKPGPLDKFV